MSNRERTQRIQKEWVQNILCFLNFFTAKKQ